jgi:hypothetical protein
MEKLLPSAQHEVALTFSADVAEDEYKCFEASEEVREHARSILCVCVCMLHYVPVPCSPSQMVAVLVAAAGKPTLFEIRGGADSAESVFVTKDKTYSLRYVRVCVCVCL